MRSLAEPGNPSADLIAAWLGLRLGIDGPARRVRRPRSHRGELRDGRTGRSRCPGRTAATPPCPGRGGRSGGWPCTAATPPSWSPRNCAGSSPDEVYAETLRALAGRFMSTPEVIVYRDGHAARPGRRGAPGHRADRRGRRPRQRVGGADRRRHRHQGARGAGRRPRPGRDRLAAPGHLVGRRALRPGRRPGAGTRPERARPCSTTSMPTRPGCTPCRARTARTGTTRTRPPPGTRPGWPLRPPEDQGPVPAFDVLMLGIGPEGHVASLFPGRRRSHDGGPVVAVRDSPKPPPTRLSLTFAVDPGGP